ncbi:MAG: SufD family Fe-S cluster assembly protein [Bacilli bacterium]|nr:SufD family Fe-S cluster assembly protein [Bacilli bacterium]
MNKIVIDNNKLLSYSDDSVIVDSKSIEFLKNSNYKIEIVNTNKLNLNIKVRANIMVKIFLFSVDNDISVNVKYELDDNSNLVVYKFYNNINNNIYEEIYLNGNNSSIYYNLSSISKNVEDYKMVIYHNNYNVKSNISNRCVGMDGSKVTYSIDSILEKGNTNCVMNQDTKIICMGDVDAKVEPNMIIDEDDVEARHGSVIGKFSYDDLFYLLSRGISEEVAISLMIKGFIMGHLDLNKKDEEKIIKIIKNEME